MEVVFRLMEFLNIFYTVSTGLQLCYVFLTCRVFKNTLEKIDLSGQSIVDLEWMAYLGAFPYLTSLSLAGCLKVSSSAIWPIAGMYMDELHVLELANQ